MQQSEFCEARMAVVSRSPDRIGALGSVLRVSSGARDLRLIGWAINELRAMKSRRADAELERYADEIDALPGDASLKRELWGKRLQIRETPLPRKR